MKKINERSSSSNSQDDEKKTIETVEEFTKEFHKHFSYDEEPMSLERISQIIDDLYKYKHWTEINSLISKFQAFSEKYQITSEKIKEFIEDKILELKYYEKKNRFLSDKERVNKKVLDAIEPFREGIEIKRMGDKSDESPSGTQ